MTDLAGHLVLFALAGAGILLAPLLIGLLVRPKLPNAEKDAIYECGEPTIGSSYIQFDLRFYTVALLFIIFDVELAFFFPWATIFGGAMQLADSGLSDPGTRAYVSGKLLNTPVDEMTSAHVISPETAQTLGIIGLFDILVFFGVLLVGFAYVWKRGDLNWVRAVTSQNAASRDRETSPSKSLNEHQPQTVA